MSVGRGASVGNWVGRPVGWKGVLSGRAGSAMNDECETARWVGAGVVSLRFQGENPPAVAVISYGKNDEGQSFYHKDFQSGRGSHS